MFYTFPLIWFKKKIDATGRQNWLPPKHARVWIRYFDHRYQTSELELTDSNRHSAILIQVLEYYYEYSRTTME